MDPTLLVSTTTSNGLRHRPSATPRAARRRAPGGRWSSGRRPRDRARCPRGPSAWAALTPTTPTMKAREVVAPTSRPRIAPPSPAYRRPCRGLSRRFSTASVRPSSPARVPGSSPMSPTEQTLLRFRSKFAEGDVQRQAEAAVGARCHGLGSYVPRSRPESSSDLGWDRRVGG